VNKRRNLLIVLGSAAVAPHMAFAQSKQPPALIGWLNGGSRQSHGHFLTAFREGLAALGWKDGSNLLLEQRWADGREERLQSLAEEIAAKNPAIIAAAPGPAVRAAAKAAPKIPIVQANGSDLVVMGLAASLARPGGMVTGVTNIVGEVSGKYLELLLAAVPKLQRVGFLADPTSVVYGAGMKAARHAIERYRVEASFAEATRPQEIEPAISRLAKNGAQALVVMSSGWYTAERQRIMKLALTHRWLVVAGLREFSEAGALISYGADRSALYRRAAYYVDRILKGAKPGDLPIEQPTKFELVINMKTARMLKLEIPRDLAVRADRVIE